MKYSIFIIAIALGCAPKQSSTDETKKDTLGTESFKIDSTTAQGIEQPEVPIENEVPGIIAIRNEISENKSRLTVWVKITGENDFVKVLNEEWPEDIETTYNVYKNQNEQILYISEMPMSESGDWDLELNHYYSETGHLIAFERRLAFFNGPCLPDAVTVQKSIELYDESFKLIKTLKSLTDANGKKLGEECKDEHFDWDPEIQPTVKAFLDSRKIKV